MTAVFLKRECGAGFIRVLLCMNLSELSSLLSSLGCPPSKSVEMAAQLDRRARQLAEQKGRSYDEALAHLLNLMSQGWATKEK